VNDRNSEPERGWGSEWELIKIILEGDGNSSKMNMASSTRLRLTTKIDQAHVAIGVPLDLETNTRPSDPRTQRNTKPRVYGEHHRSDRSKPESPQITKQAYRPPN
jgi:hypothetical protein